MISNAYAWHVPGGVNYTLGDLAFMVVAALLFVGLVALIEWFRNR